MARERTLLARPASPPLRPAVGPPRRRARLRRARFAGRVCAIERCTRRSGSWKAIAPSVDAPSRSARSDRLSSASASSSSRRCPRRRCGRWPARGRESRWRPVGPASRCPFGASASGASLVPVVGLRQHQGRQDSARVALEEQRRRIQGQLGQVDLARQQARPGEIQRQALEAQRARAALDRGGLQWAADLEVRDDHPARQPPSSRPPMATRLPGRPPPRRPAGRPATAEAPASPAPRVPPGPAASTTRRRFQGDGGAVTRPAYPPRPIVALDRQARHRHPAPSGPSASSAARKSARTRALPCRAPERGGTHARELRERSRPEGGHRQAARPQRLAGDRAGPHQPVRRRHRRPPVDPRRRGAREAGSRSERRSPTAT